MKGRFPHPVPLNLWDPFGFTKKMTPERKEKALLAEINNGARRRLPPVTAARAFCPTVSFPAPILLRPRLLHHGSKRSLGREQAASR